MMERIPMSDIISLLTQLYLGEFKTVRSRLQIYRKEKTTRGENKTLQTVLELLTLSTTNKHELKTQFQKLTLRI